MTIMNKDNAGRRVELIHTDDRYTKLRPGSRGTYQYCLDQEGGDGEPARYPVG